MQSNSKEVKKIWKKVLAAVICIVVIAAGGGVFFLKTRKVNASLNVEYKEYIVKRGDIEVGIKEDGKTSMNLSGIKFPVNAKIEEVFVNEGQKVVAGTPLIKFNYESLKNATDKYEVDIAQAKKVLDEAKYEQSSGVKTAKAEYEKSIGIGNYAQEQNEVDKKEIDYSISSAQMEVDDLKAELEKYTLLQQTDDNDKATLDFLKNQVEELTDELNELKGEFSDYTEENSDDLAEYKSINAKYESAKDSYKAAQKEYEYYCNEYGENSPEATAKKEALKKAEYNLEIAEEDWEDVEDDYDEINETIDSYNERIDECSAELEKASDDYSDFSAEFKEKYDVSGNDLDEKVKSLTKELEDAQHELDSKLKSYSYDVNSIDSDLESKMTEYALAKEKYDHTVNELAAQVQIAQQNYNLLVAEYEQIKKEINSDGILNSPCEGTIAEINYSSGDDYIADNDIVLISSKDFAYFEILIDESNINSVAIAEKAEVKLSAFDEKIFPATVDSISHEPEISDSGDAQYTVKLKLSMQDGVDFYEGMGGEASLIKEQANGVLYIPKEALTYEGEKVFVLVKNANGIQNKAEIQTGLSDGENVEVKSGLKEGDVIIVQNISETGLK